MQKYRQAGEWDLETSLTGLPENTSYSNGSGYPAMILVAQN